MIRRADFGCGKQKFLFTTKIERQRQISVTLPRGARSSFILSLITFKVCEVTNDILGSDVEYLPRDEQPPSGNEIFEIACYHPIKSFLKYCSGFVKMSAMFSLVAIFNI